MVQIEFNYQQIPTIIQINAQERFELAVSRFTNKTGVNPNEVSFLSDGRVINLNDNIQNILSDSERQNQRKVILVIPLNSTINMGNNNHIIQSKEIICPYCHEPCKFEIKNYRIKLFDCIKGHMLENIKLKEFNNYQKIDLAKIICDDCKKNNKGETFKNEFYRCMKCNMNLCPLSVSVHDKSHYILEYDLKNYKCNIHKNEQFIKYCKTCKKDICLECENQHLSHETISFSTMLPDIEKMNNNITELRKVLDTFNENINRIILKLNYVKDNFEIFYNINNNIIKDYINNKNRSYNKLYNISNVNNIIDKEIDYIKDKCNFGNNINELIYTYGEMKNENREIEMKYIPFQDLQESERKGIFGYNNNNNSIRIFGKKFIENNIQKCKIIYNDKIYELSEYFDDINLHYNNKDEFKFILKGINNITDMSYMFEGCKLLYSLPDISNIDTSNVTNMKYMFAGCYSLRTLPDISKFNTSKVIDLECLFAGCSYLQSLPDISKWDISNVNNISNMFDSCLSLTSLPDISKWNTFNIIDMRAMFLRCTFLKSLPDISKWNISNVKYMKNMFFLCKPYLNIPYKFKN